LRLLAESRETTEKVIDELFKQLQGTIPRKPRCNCIKSLLKNPACAKMNKPSSPDARSAGAKRLPVFLRVD
jgi:hypothetical protein